MSAPLTAAPISREEKICIDSATNGMEGVRQSEKSPKGVNAHEMLWVLQQHIPRALMGAKLIDVAESLNDLAYLYQIQGHYQEAETYYLKSLNMAKSAISHYTPDKSPWNDTLQTNNPTRSPAVRECLNRIKDSE